ncbi:hypothetical protein ACTXT7_015909 [Hymenolepis weldensis]
MQNNEHLMPDTSITNEMRRHAVIVSIKAKYRNLEIARFLLIATAFVCEVRKALLNDKNRDELASTGKRKEHCQRSANPLTQNTCACVKSGWYGVAWLGVAWLGVAWRDVKWHEGRKSW